MSNERQPLTIVDVLHYEVRASWWASHVSIGWMQTLAAKWFAFKARRKYARYQWMNGGKDRIRQCMEAAGEK